jgi:hypothetical protein
LQYFTLDEANELLPRLNVLVVELARVHEQVLSLRHEVTGVLDKSDANSGNAAASRMYVLFLRFEELIREIDRLGVEVKDPASGLCDFPALHEGRDIYLCWRMGEQQIEWWHELHAGFAGRRHITELR